MIDFLRVNFYTGNMVSKKIIIYAVVFLLLDFVFSLFLFLYLPKKGKESSINIKTSSKETKEKEVAFDFEGEKVIADNVNTTGPENQKETTYTYEGNIKYLGNNYLIIEKADKKKVKINISPTTNFYLSQKNTIPPLLSISKNDLKLGNIVEVAFNKKTTEKEFVTLSIVVK